MGTDSIRTALVRHLEFLKTVRRSVWIVVALVITIGVLYVFLASPPRSFPVGETLTIEDGWTLSDVSAELKRKGVISSRLFFEAVVIMRAGEGGVLSGDYRLPRTENAWTLSRRLVRGEFFLELTRVLIPEGLSLREMVPLYEKRFPRFDADLFLRLAKDDEGYLFPDTYYFLPNAGAVEIYAAMRENFTEKIALVESDIAASGRPLHDIVTMASLLELEARTTETRRTISGILWKRLALGMPLQVDAVFPYINGKNTYTLTREDLQVDSPYNTYKYKGLPPGPVGSPGLDSILAAAHPIESPYLYYLSDRDGNVYYSRTFEEHVAKKAKYVR